jgi:hypothetical protein
MARPRTYDWDELKEMAHPEAARKSGKGQDRAHLLDELRIAELAATSAFVDDLTQAAASRHSALGLQCRHRVSTSAPCSFLATRSLRVRSMF